MLVKNMSDNTFMFFTILMGIVLVVGLISFFVWGISLVWKWLKSKPKYLSIICFFLFIICIALATFLLVSYEAYVYTLPLDIETMRIVFSVFLFIGASSFFVWIFSLGNRLARKIGIVLLPIFLTIAFLYIFAIRIHKVKGNNMEVLYKDGAYILGDIVSYITSSPKRGDVVIFAILSIEEGFSEDRIGRVVGLPGENISIQNGKVYINKKPLVESYLAAGTETKTGLFLREQDVLIPQGWYVIMVDYRNSTNDSRMDGFIKKDWIKEKIFYSIGGN